MDYDKLKKRLIEKGLKVTSRRLSILEAIIELNHPTAEEILKYIRKNYPDTATATVYKALNVLVEKKVIKRVNSETDINRYDANMESHHHLYCTESDRIEDYNDEELTGILKKYFENIKIPGFDIEDFKLQINGKFTDKT
ncbi:MAG: Fur family transcriptional regulator [Bacteroidales bacterium]